jgi:Diguanylate cyclase, GGDEF domain
VVPALDGAVIDGLTASVGAACVGPGEDFERALRAADACLYAAKRGGRNQVRVAGAGAVDVPAPRAAADALRRSTSRADAVP